MATTVYGYVTVYANQFSLCAYSSIIILNCIYSILVIIQITILYLEKWGLETILLL